MQFRYQALDSQNRQVSGMLEASDMRQALRQLQRNQLTVVQLDGARPAAFAPRTGRPKTRDLFLALHELTTLLEAGVSLIEAVESLASSHHHPVLVQNFAKIGAQLRQGQTFSQALHESDLRLPWYIAQLAEAGELTGKLGSALRDGVAQMEYDNQIRDEMRNAMIYPTILVFSGIVAVLLIFTLVVPRFAGILQSKGGELPLLAQFVLSTGMFMHTYWMWIAGALAGVIGVFVSILKKPAWRAAWQDRLSTLPLLGEWLLEAETGRWAAMLGTLLENRVPMLRALELARQGVQLPRLQARLAQVSKAVRGGTHLSQALLEHQAITGTGHNLVRAGERAGELARMLKSLAKLYAESGRVRMKRFLLLLEPIAILVIGGVIGVIITGVILAITSVNQIGF
jgi:general secretion pathway protein F